MTVSRPSSDPEILIPEVLVPSSVSGAVTPSHLPKSASLAPLGSTLSFAAFAAFVALAQSLPASAQVVAPARASAATKSTSAKASTPRAIPSQAQIALERGRQLRQSGEITLAEAQFRSALALAPQLGAAHRELARLLTEQSRWAEARTEWNSVLALAPTDKEAGDVLRQIDQRTGRVTPPGSGQPTLAQPQTRSSAEARPRPESAKPQGGTPLALPAKPVTKEPLTAKATPAAKVTPNAKATPPTNVEGVTPPRVAKAPPVIKTAPTATPQSVPVTPTPVPPQITAIKAPLASATTPTRPKTGTRPTITPSAPPLKLNFSAPPRVKVPPKRAQRAYTYVNEGALLLKTNLPERALQAYKLGYAADPYNPYAASGIATSLLVLGRFDESAQAYARALAILPATGKNAKLRTDAQRGLADTLTYGKHYEQALQANNSILARRPNDFTSLYQVAQIYTFSNQYDRAKTFYERTLKVTPPLRRAQVLASYGETLTYAGDNAGAQKQLQAALNLNPKSPAIRRSLANAALYSGDYAKAIAAYRAVLAVNPQDVDAHLGLGEALTFANQPTSALPSFKTALRLQPNSVRAHLGLGRAYVVMRRFREALPELNIAVNAQPDNNDARLLLAIAQSETGDVQGAQRNYDRLLKQQSSPLDQANTQAAIGDLQAKNGNAQAANAAYARALQLAPQNSDIALRSAAYLLGQERYDEARKLAQGALNRDPNSLRAQIVLLAVEARAGNQERAAALARRLSATTPPNFDDAVLLVSSLRDAGENEAAGRLLDRLIEQTSNDPAAQLRLANTARDTGQFGKAVPLYRAYLAQNPGDAEARVGLATVLSYDNQLDAAQGEINRVLAAEPTNEQALVLAATIGSYRGTPESLGEAESRFLAALARDPNNVRALSGLGFTLSARGRYADSIERYQAAVNLAPDDTVARLGLARNLNYARRPEASIVQYEEVLRRSPNDNGVRLELAQIYLDNNRLSDAERLYQEIVTVGGHYTASNTLFIPAPNQRLVALQLAPQADPSRVLPLVQRVNFKPKGQRKTGKPLNLRLAQAAPDSSGAGQTGGGAVGTPGGGGNPTTPATPAGPAGNDGPAPNGQAPAGGAAPQPGAGVPPITPGAATTVTPPVPIPPVSAGNGAPAPTSASRNEERLALRGLAEVRRRQGRYEEAVGLFRQVLTADETDTTARLGLAQSLRATGDYAAALTETETLLSTAGQEQNLTARVLRAQLLSDVGRGAEAQSELNALAQGIENAPVPPTLDNYLALSEAFAGLTNYDAALAVLDRGQRDYSNESALVQRRGEVLLAARRYDEARTAFNQLLTANAENVDAELGVARSYNYANRLVEAEAAYRTVLGLQPRSFAGRLELADILSRRGEYPQSIELYQSAITDAPGNLGARVEFARVLRYNRRYADSLDVLNQVIEADPRSVSALTERGILRGQTGDYEPGLADLRQALQIAPDSLAAQLGVAEVLSYQGNYQESIRLYRAALERDPSNQKARTELGLALSYAGQNTEALQEIDTVLKNNPNNLDAQIARASSLGRARQYPQSIAAFKTILVRSPNSQRAQLGLAESYVAAGQFNNAVGVYDGLLRLEPNNVSYAVARAQAIGYAGRTTEAVSALQTLLRANPGNLRARLALAETLTNSRNRNLRAAAIREYRSILDAQPSNVSARFGLGRALSYQGDYSGADRELNQVLQAQPNNTEALYEIAQAQRLAGKPFDARDSYRRVLTIDPRSARAREGLDLLTHTTSPGITPFFRFYNDTNGVRLRSYGIGPTVPFRFGTIGASYENGTFSDEGIKLRRNAINLLLSRNTGSLEARLLVSGVNYSNVDDGNGTRFLYDAYVQKSGRNGRQRIFGNIASREVIESIGSVNFDIRARNYGIGAAYPLGRFDAEGTFYRLEYSDSNKRNIATAALLYRILDNTPKGTFRVGLGQRYENTKFLPARYLGEYLYYAPQNFSATSILADYQLFSNKLKLGIYGAYPLTDSQGDNGFGRPAKTVFGNVTYYPNRFLELFATGGIVRSPDFDSNQANVGATIRF